MGNFNNLTIQVYEAGSDTPVVDVAAELLRGNGLSHETFYPGGLYGPCEFFIPRDVTAGWPFTGGQRLVIRNDLAVVWEGVIASVGYAVGAGAEQGRRVRGVGYWGWLLGTQGIDKPWADIRLGEDVWKWNITASGVEKCTLDRTNRIRFTPKNVAWANGDVAAVQFTAPTGQTIKRVTYSYDLQEGGGDWIIFLFNDTSGASVVTTSATGTGTVDHTLATPASSIQILFYSNAAQTPAADGTVYGEVSSVVVYTETGSINAQEITEDIRALVGELNSDETRIGPLTLALVPFVTNGYEPFADILARAASYGDASFNSWAVYLDHSETATAPDGKPVLVLEQYPDLDDYDYAVRIDDPNLQAPFEVVKDYEGIRNYIVVRYRDELNNRDVIVTPDDDANLKDATSITDHGQREYTLDAGLTTETAAINLGRRYLAAKKDVKFYVSSAITVVGYIRAKNGQAVPASEIRAGKRVKVENFIVDEVGVSGAGLTFLISHTRYDDAGETCAITCGVPDDLAVIVAQLALGNKISSGSNNTSAVFGPLGGR